jgi:hypothetical protein
VKTFIAVNLSQALTNRIGNSSYAQIRFITAESIEAVYEQLDTDDVWTVLPAGVVTEWRETA